MSTYYFSQTSKDNLEQADEDLQKIFNLGIQRSKIDFGVTASYRTPEEQLEYFKKGREYKCYRWVVTNPKKVITNADGYHTKGKHNYLPSLAVDIYIYVPGKPHLAYETSHLSYVAGVLQSVAKELLADKEITHNLIWGNNWDDDGEIIFDHDLQDGPHFEIRKI